MITSLASLIAFAASVRADIESTGIVPADSQPLLGETVDQDLSRRAFQILKEVSWIEEEDIAFFQDDKAVEWADAYIAGEQEGTGMKARIAGIKVELEQLHNQMKFFGR